MFRQMAVVILSDHAPWPDHRTGISWRFDAAASSPLPHADFLERESVSKVKKAWKNLLIHVDATFDAVGINDYGTR
jgi:hypothetical protein